MSDIKYIIAGSDDDGEHTRFGCLAVVRYAVAAMVTVLTITVIALSIHAVLRPEDIGLSVNKGYISADTLWTHTPATSSVNKVAEQVTAAAKLSHRRALLSDDDDLPVSTVETSDSELAPTVIPLPKNCFLGCSGPSGKTRDQPTQVTFKKADRTNLRVILIANNPGGRTKIDCNDTRVSLIDMFPPHGQIGNVTVANFTVPPQTTVTLPKRLNNTDTGYIWENYNLATRFSVRVVVTSSVTSYPLGKQGKTVQQKYTCQPVTVGLIEDEAFYASDDHVHCTASSSG